MSKPAKHVQMHKDFTICSWAPVDIKVLFPSWSDEKCWTFLDIYDEDIYDVMLQAAMEFIKDKGKREVKE